MRAIVLGLVCLGLAGLAWAEEADVHPKCLALSEHPDVFCDVQPQHMYTGVPWATVVLAYGFMTIQAESLHEEEADGVVDAFCIMVQRAQQRRSSSRSWSGVIGSTR